MLKPWMCLDCRVMMNQVDQDHCRCPQCGIEVWSPIDRPSGDEIAELMRDMAKCHARTTVLPAGQPAPGGSSKSSKGRKKPQKKDSLSQLNRKLYYET